MTVGVISEPQWLTDLYQSLARSGRIQLLALLFAYAVIVLVTNRVLITAPARYQLLSDIDAERVELAINGSSGPTVRSQSRSLFRSKERMSTVEEARNIEKEIQTLLTLAAGTVARVRWSVDGSENIRPHAINKPFATLAKVMAGRRYLHSAERLRIRYLSTSDVVISESAIIVSRLAEVQSNHARAVTSSIVSALNRSHSGAGARQTELLVLLAEARRVVYDADDRRLERAAEGQRRVMWMTSVGLLLLLAFGLAGRREIMLFGALGGLLAPLTTAWQAKGDDDNPRKTPTSFNDAEYIASWGTLLLGPVAGALAAFGGLLLLQFLADEKLNVLGEVFRTNSWTEPITPFGLALALLFGFSGGLFGKVALRAALEVLPPTTPEAPGDREAGEAPGTAASPRPILPVPQGDIQSEQVEEVKDPEPSAAISNVVTTLARTAESLLGPDRSPDRMDVRSRPAPDIDRLVEEAHAGIRWSVTESGILVPD